MEIYIDPYYEERTVDTTDTIATFSPQKMPSNETAMHGRTTEIRVTMAGPSGRTAALPWSGGSKKTKKTLGSDPRSTQPHEHLVPKENLH